VSEISIADVDQAEAALAAAREAYYASDKTDADKVAFGEAKRAVVEVRSAWRAQEESAGRRGPVGGDAVVTNEEN
jgi:hypothetical protein